MILLSSPNLLDPNFVQSAILMVEHTVDGAFGIILNRPTDITLEQVAVGVEGSWGGLESNVPVYEGGPVMRETIWLLYEPDSSFLAAQKEREEPDRTEVLPGIYFTSDPETIRFSLAHPSGRYRFFLGYAGWGEGQLDAEVAAGGWLLSTLNKDMIFYEPAQSLWEDTLDLMGVSPQNFVDSGGTVN